MTCQWGIPVKKKPTAILSNRLYVPSKHVTNAMRKAFTEEVYDEKFCGNCSHDDCDGCSGKKATIKFYKDFGDWVGFSRGDLRKIKKVFSGFRIEDHRVSPKFDYDLRFTGELYSNQVAVVSEFRRHKYGQIQAPARSGKTVMIAHIVCKLKCKTAIFAHQKDLLDQFKSTFENHTNVKDLRKFHETDAIVGIPKSIEDIDNFDVCLFTYQSFISTFGVKKLKKVQKLFGCVIVDESHRASAHWYSRILNYFPAKYKFGCTATPTRKDKLHIIAENILGPVTVIGTSNQLVCKVYYHNTGYDPTPFVHWNTLVNRLTKNKQRNQLIVDKAIQDLNNGRFLFIVTMRRAHADVLADEIAKHGFNAVSFYAGKPRDKILTGARNGEIQCVVATRQLAKEGLDVPKWDTYYCTVPIAQEEGYYQECSRVRTPYVGKPVPIIRYFVDKCGAAYACRSIVSKIHVREGFESETLKHKNKLSW